MKHTERMEKTLPPKWLGILSCCRRGRAHEGPTSAPRCSTTLAELWTRAGRSAVGQLGEHEHVRRPAGHGRLPLVLLLGDRQQSEKDVGPEVGPTSAFFSCIPAGMHGPTCIFWANLTPFPVQPEGPYTIKAFNVSMGSGWPANGDFTLFQVGLGRTNIFGASISETTMRPNPTSRMTTARLTSTTTPTAALPGPGSPIHPVLALTVAMR
jgi:hypothetical protein